MTTIDTLQEIFRDVLDDEDIVLSESATANDVESWDSLNHISLIAAVEQRFGVRINAVQAAELENVGQFIELVDSLRESQPS